RATNNMATIRDALQRFYDENGYYPCPADPTLANTASAFGAAQASGTGDCDASNKNLFYKSTHSVVMGVVPVRSLGLADTMMYDAWGSRMFYAVDEAFTQQVSG